MSRENKARLTSGEFARLCGTTKETLFHYDEIGLLKPALVGENGYRYYAPFQFFLFDMVATMKQTGSSLKEIRGYMDRYEPGHFLAMLREKREELERERRKIEGMERLIGRTIKDTEFAVAALGRPPEIREMGREYLIVCPSGREDGHSMGALVERLSEHFDHCARHPEISKTPLGAIISRADLLAGINRDSWYFSQAPRRINSSRLLIRPKGRYLTQVFQGDNDDRAPVLKGLVHLAKERGLEIVGDAYIYEIVGHLATRFMDRAISLAAIEVKEK